MGIAGGYLIYLAYELYRGRSDTSSSMSPAVQVLFIVLFGILGAALIVYAVILWRRSRNPKEEQEAPKPDDNSLK